MIKDNFQEVCIKVHTSFCIELEIDVSDLYDKPDESNDSEEE